MFIQLFLWLAAVAPALQQKIELQLLHSTNGVTFEQAGTLEGTIGSNGHPRDTMMLQRSTFSDDEIAQFNKLVRQNGVYRIKIPSSLNSNSAPTLVSSIPARCLAAGDFNEHLSLHLSPNGDIMSVGYKISNFDCAKALSNGEGNLESQQIQFNSLVTHYSPHTAAGVRPDEMKLGGPQGDASRSGQPSPGGPNAPNQANKQEPPQDLAAWLKKNWLFVALGIFVIAQLTAPPPEEPAAAGRQGGQQPQGRAAR